MGQDFGHFFKSAKDLRLRFWDTPKSTIFNNNYLKVVELCSKIVALWNVALLTYNISNHNNFETMFTYFDISGFENCGFWGVPLPKPSDIWQGWGDWKKLTPHQILIPLGFKPPFFAKTSPDTIWRPLESKNSRKHLPGYPRGGGKILALLGPFGALI